MPENALKLTVRQVRMIDSFVISVVITFVMTMVMTAVNVGVNARFLPAFAVSFIIGVVVSFPTGLLLVPPITRWVNQRIGAPEPALDEKVWEESAT